MCVEYYDSNMNCDKYKNTEQYSASVSGLGLRPMWIPERELTMLTLGEKGSLFPPQHHGVTKKTQLVTADILTSRLHGNIVPQ